jgi:hypothetical protein
MRSASFRNWGVLLIAFGALIAILAGAVFQGYFPSSFADGFSSTELATFAAILIVAGVALRVAGSE